MSYHLPPHAAVSPVQHDASDHSWTRLATKLVELPTGCHCTVAGWVAVVIAVSVTLSIRFVVAVVIIVVVVRLRHGHLGSLTCCLLRLSLGADSVVGLLLLLLLMFDFNMVIFVSLQFR